MTDDCWESWCTLVFLRELSLLLSTSGLLWTIFFSRQLALSLSLANRSLFKKRLHVHNNTCQNCYSRTVKQLLAHHGRGWKWYSSGRWAPELQLSNIEHLWALQLALMVQKCHLGTAPQDICKKLNRTKHSHETRGNQSSFTPFRPLTTSGSVCFSNRAPLIWNFLPQPIRTCTSYTSFKSHFLDLKCPSTLL